MHRRLNVEPSRDGVARMSSSGTLCIPDRKSPSVDIVEVGEISEYELAEPAYRADGTR